MKKLPKTLWVVRENAGKGTDEFYSAYENIDYIDDGSVVGEYTLTTLNKKRVLHQLDEHTKKKRT